MSTLRDVERAIFDEAAIQTSVLAGLTSRLDDTDPMVITQRGIVAGLETALFFHCGETDDYAREQIHGRVQDAADALKGIQPKGRTDVSKSK